MSGHTLGDILKDALEKNTQRDQKKNVDDFADKICALLSVGLSPTARRVAIADMLSQYSKDSVPISKMPEWLAEAYRGNIVNSIKALREETTDSSGRSALGLLESKNLVQNIRFTHDKL